jgi:hypothetical protein
MALNRIVRLLTISGLLLTLNGISFAQNATPTAPAPDAAKLQEEKAKLEGKASVMLEQVIGEAQALKLPENRIRVQIVAGDLLWDRSAARARALFTDAGAVLSQLMLESDSDSDRQDAQMLIRLRQELVLSAARHDAELAYQLLRQTQPPASMTNAGNNRRRGMFDQQDNLEPSLLAVIAASDPKAAYQKAAESLDKGEYPMSLNRVLAQLQSKDPENFKKLSDKTLNRLGSDNLLASPQAASLAMNLLRPGPRAATTTTNVSTTNVSSVNPSATNSQVLTESGYHDLLDRAVTAALSATPRTNTGGGGGNQRRMQRNATNSVIIGSDSQNGPVSVYMDPPRDTQTPPDPAQVQQNNARMLLRGLQGMLTQIDQYLPERSQALKQKLTELGMGNNTAADLGNQMRNVMMTGDSESLMNAASVSPGPLQSALYEQAAQRSIDEGNTDRALQIASEHLDESSRKLVMQAIDFKKLTTTVSAEKLGEIRQKLAALPSDGDRIKYLVDLATATQKDNPKLSLRFAEDARSLVSKRAANYTDLENQIRVAELFATLDPKRSFDVLEPGISQLNELFAAAQVLNGFEVQVFRDGELPLQGGNGLSRMVTRYGQQLASLAKLDFERAQMTADRFQFTEPRLMAKLAIVQGAFGVRQTSLDNNRRFDFRFNFPR